MLNGIAPQQIVNLTSLLKEYPISNLYEKPSANVLFFRLKIKTKQTYKTFRT
jgi:hypothetical protein